MDSVNYATVWYVDSESNRAISEETRLEALITSEETRAINAEAILQAAIDSESARAVAEEAILLGLISSEAIRAKSVEATKQIKLIAGTNITLTSEGIISAEGKIKDVLIDGTSIVTSEGIADITTLATRNELADEVARAINSEGLLRSDLNDEIVRAYAAEILLQGSVDSEANRAINKETLILNALDSEANRAKDAEDTITLALNDEIARAINSEGELRVAIEAEEVRAISVENLLLSLIDSEANRAKNSEGELRLAINNEIDRSLLVDNYLSVLINSESARAQTAEALLDANKQNNLIAGDNITISSEGIISATGGKVGDVLVDSESVLNSEGIAEIVLQPLIDIETIRATNEELQLQANIDSEAILRFASDSALNVSIANERSRAINAEAQLSSDIITGDELVIDWVKAKFVYDPVDNSLDIQMPV